MKRADKTRILELSRFGMKVPRHRAVSHEFGGFIQTNSDREALMGRLREIRQIVEKDLRA